MFLYGPHQQSGTSFFPLEYKGCDEVRTSEKFSYLYDMQNGGAKLHHDIKIISMSNINVQDSWREWKETR